MVVQLVQASFMLVYAFNLNDYSERSVSAMECERSCNPLIDGVVAIRVLQIMQALFTGSYITACIFAAYLGYLVWRIKSNSIYVDATNLWREVNKFEKESYILLAIDVLLIVAVLIIMVVSIISKYSE